MLNYFELEKCFGFFKKEIKEEISRHCFIKTFMKSEEVLRQGSYAKILPVVNDGLIKVFSEANEVEFHLYYLHSKESCILNYSHIFNQSPINFTAVAEEETSVICLPIRKVREWITRYPSFVIHILAEYQRQFNNLLNTTKQISCYNLDDRLLLYLEDQARHSQSNTIFRSHQKIATDLSTSREVISRTIKKLENKNKLVQHSRSIELL
jgi:CRP/FNR family transcriptional regulator